MPVGCEVPREYIELVAVRNEHATKRGVSGAHFVASEVDVSEVLGVVEVVGIKE